jgi:hypothetical protein
MNLERIAAVIGVMSAPTNSPNADTTAQSRPCRARCAPAACGREFGEARRHAAGFHFHRLRRRIIDRDRDWIAHKLVSMRS